jgi:alternate signal-mediated exported protein
MKTMRTRTKAGIAAGAATVLLMGGFGSTALWMDAAPSSQVSVSTGHLRISDGTPGEWTDVSVTPNAPFDPENDYLVPGDRVRSTTEFTIDAEGQNLRAELSFSDAAADLPDDVTVTAVDITLDGEQFDPETDQIQPGDDQELEVTFEIAFDIDAEGSQNQPVNVDSVKAIVSQARP